MREVVEGRERYREREIDRERKREIETHTQSPHVLLPGWGAWRVIWFINREPSLKINVIKI